jgi:hypothetical protein
MRKRIIAAVAAISVVLIPVPEVRAQSSTVCTAGNVVPFASETIVVSTNAVVLTRATYAPGGGINPATVALISVQGGNDIRIWLDGTAPTDTVGIIVSSGQSLYVCGTVLGTFKAIRDGSSDSELAVQYFNQAQ